VIFCVDIMSGWTLRQRKRYHCVLMSARNEGCLSADRARGILNIRLSDNAARCTERQRVVGGRPAQRAFSGFWAMAARTNSSWAPRGATQSKPVEPQDALEVRKPHLDLLALTSRLFETLRANE
jgi:hypothetical protein